MSGHVVLGPSASRCRTYMGVYVRYHKGAVHTWECTYGTTGLLSSEISELGESLDADNAVSSELTCGSRDLTVISPLSEFRLGVVTLNVAEILGGSGTSGAGEVPADAEAD